MERPSSRIVPIAGGILAALFGFALLFWAIAFFVPRFLRAAGDGRVRFLLIIAMSVIVLLNVFQRYRRRRTMPNKQEKSKAVRHTRSGA